MNGEMKCCGCGACAAACPTARISMSYDAEGFPVPDMIASACTNCGMCKKVCPSLKDPGKFDPEYTNLYYAAVHRDPFVLKNSSSGGLFTALTDAFMKRGGIVYGCVLVNTSEARHRRATSPQERDAMRGSKYIQSDLNESYGQISNDLSKGSQVYFSGTPCQCAAVRLFLEVNGIPIDRLFLQEVLCHGVGSPAFFQAYILAMEKKFKGKAIQCKFRAKAAVGKKQDMEIIFSNGKRYNALSTMMEAFYKPYHANLILRESCYDCKYAREKRISDISLADFWGYKGSDKAGEEDLAYSLCVVSSKRGALLLEECRHNLSILLNVSESSLGQQNALTHPAPRPINRDSFREDLISGGFHRVNRKYGNNNLPSRIKLAALWAGNKSGLLDALRRQRNK